MSEPLDEEIVRAIGRRDRALAETLGSLDDERLLMASALPGWSVLTIACHLRYGAEATLALTEDMVAGRAGAYYPLGRARQRDATLRPRAGEHPGDVVRSLIDRSAALNRRWSELSSHDWDRTLVEPEDNVDLGPVPLRSLAILRLTEVEVHGTDLALGLDDWSEAFVAVALPMRLHWLAKRRSNHRATGDSIDGIWRIAADDGPSVLVRSIDGRVDVSDESETPPDAAIIEASGRDLLGFLLGRADASRLRFAGNRDTAARFTEAFPPP